MANWKKSIPDGTRDILFKDCADKVRIQETLKKVYIKRGFSEIITPTLEFYDVFDGEKAGIEQEKMYKLLDNKGRIMVLRPDITTPVARLAATKLRESYYPLKLCYSQNVFRTNEDLNAKRNEFTQSGIEIIGCSGLRADIEVITTAIRALLEVGIDNFKVELGQIEFYKGIIEDLNLAEEEKEEIREFIENKNFGSLKDFLFSSQDSIDKESIAVLNNLPALFGSMDVLKKAENMTSNKRSLKALRDLEHIYGMLKAVGLDKYVSLDLGMVHHIDYYSGLIFRVYIEGIGENVLYGGRYDGLVNNFGLDVPATGFAINVDKICEVLKGQQVEFTASISPDYIIHCSGNMLGKADSLMERIIEKGFKCEISLFDDREDTVSYGLKRKIGRILIIEENGEIYEHNQREKTLREFSLPEVKL
ncbi:MAG: ATP phosphoribosyltransferase regulatory subunit [Bacillota bacterium]|nr:ATP phosphoribosyltransferase regulatory subunit [Bacillota bacterium]